MKTPTWLRTLRTWPPARPATRRARTRLAAEPLEARAVPALTAMLVEDINTAPADGGPSALADVGGVVFFAATTPDRGTELWKTDGTAAGTALVADIEPGVGSSSPSNLVNVNGTLYFAATTAAHGRELWRSDGTAAGTARVADINPGANSSSPSALANVGGTLYFAANDGVAGAELWKSDGTAGGTVLVANINPGAASSNPANLFNHGGTLYFAATDGVAGAELWRSDGTAAGTVLVKDINPGSAGSFPFLLTRVGGTLFFRATDVAAGSELWKSDGTAAGTVLVKDINPGPAGSGPGLLNNVNGVLVFAATEPGTGRELYRSDGTAAGTVLLRDINPGPADALSGITFVDPPDTSAAVVGGSLYFKANDGVAGFELWKTDGTAAGTVLVKDINPGPAGSVNEFFLPGMVDVDGTLFFRADDGAHGAELWRSDGTDAGTVLVKDINPGPAASFSIFDQPMVAVNGTLFFRATDGVAGVELWRSDGTAAGTAIVADVFPGAASSFPAGLTDVNGTLFFAATDPVHGRELWKVVEAVQIDIKPGEWPNSINLRSNGNIPVAVLTTPDFDAAAVDTSDLSRLRFGDVQHSARVSPTRAKLEDVDGDGDLDLLLFFSTREVRETGALVADSALAELTGFTRSGQFIRGTDSVRIVGQGGGGPKSYVGPAGAADPAGSSAGPADGVAAGGDQPAGGPGPAAPTAGGGRAGKARPAALAPEPGGLLGPDEGGGGVVAGAPSPGTRLTVGADGRPDGMGKVRLARVCGGFLAPEPGDEAGDWWGVRLDPAAG